MARQLRARGLDIALLVLIDSLFSRQSEIEAATPDEIQWLVDVAEILERSRGQVAPGVSLEATRDPHPKFSYHKLHHLTASQREQALLEHLKGAQIIPQETGLEDLRKQLRIVRANANSQRIYRPHEPYQGDLVLLCCQEKTYDPLAMWLPWVKGQLSIQSVPGDHFSMLTEPFVQALAAQLQRYLG
jgi:thioesterase domain-containing protein